MTALFGLLLIGWSLLAPIGSPPDETEHGDLVMQQATGASYPAYNDRRESTAMLSAFWGYEPGFLGHWLTPEAARAEAEKTFDDWGGAKPGGHLNQQPQHPPLYYKGMGFALRVERQVGADATTPLRDEWWFLRLLNALMVLPLPFLAWAAARRLGGSDTVAISAAVTPLAVPQLLHIGGSINNDNLLILLCGVLAVLVAGVLRDDTSIWTALGVGVIVGLAALTKAFALALVPWVALVYAHQAWRTRPRWRQSAVAGVVAGGAAALLGGWWYVRNLSRYGELSPSRADTTFGTRFPGFEPDPVWYVRHFIGAIVHRFWGDFGRFLAPMTTSVVVAATFLVGACIVFAFLPHGGAEPTQANEDESGPVARGVLAVFGSLLGLLVIFVFVNAYKLYDSSGRTPFIQGRYLYAAMVPFSVLVAVGATRMIGRGAPLATLAAATVMHVDGVRVALRAWWAEPQASFSRSFDAMIAWSPASTTFVHLLVIAIVVALSLASYCLFRQAQSLTGSAALAGGPAMARRRGRTRSRRRRNQLPRRI